METQVIQPKTENLDVNSILDSLQIPKEAQDSTNSTKLASFRSDLQIALAHGAKETTIGFASGKKMYNVHFDREGKVTTEVVARVA